jgi:phage tail-like protein
MTLENLSDRPVFCRLEIWGNFPYSGGQFSSTNWCDWQPELPDDIASLFALAPRQRIVQAVVFQAPADFFEQQQAINRYQTQLQLDYQGQIRVYLGHHSSIPAIAQQLVDEQSFNLFVRPDSTYLKFLPNFYRDVDFIGRFLSIFEQGFDPAVQVIDTLWAYLDPLTAPEAILPFLAHWVAWPLDTRWEIARQRQLIRHALMLYRWHGTRWGLRFYLHLYTGLPLDDHLPEAKKHIAIEENYCQGMVLNSAALGQETILGGGQPYHFVVRLRSFQPVPLAFWWKWYCKIQNAQARKAETLDLWFISLIYYLIFGKASQPGNDLRQHEPLIREIIEQQKPAFCSYELEIKS